MSRADAVGFGFAGGAFITSVVAGVLLMQLPLLPPQPAAVRTPHATAPAAVRHTAPPVRIDDYFVQVRGEAALKSPAATLSPSPRGTEAPRGGARPSRPAKPTSGASVPSRPSPAPSASPAPAGVPSCTVRLLGLCIVRA